jgi:hypothetical protein
MVIRRVVTVAAAIAVSVSLAVAQQAPKQQQKKRSKQEQAEIEAIVKLVDGVMAGQPSPSDVQMTVIPYFLKSAENRTFVPFVLELKGAPAADVAMYVRLVNPAAQPDPKTKKVEYPWDDIHFVPATQVAGAAPRLNRVLMAPAGSYHLYIALRERLPEKAPKNQVAKAAVLKHELVVPDYYNAELNTSSVLVTDTVNSLTAPLSPDEARERPFVFGNQELVPAQDMEFKKTEELSVFFQVYNAGLDQAGKPNLTMEYEFHRKEGTGEKFFNKTSPQNYNASNLPPQFDPIKFPVPGGVTVPLASFADGDYRLAIKISDKAANKTLTKDVNFSVKSS